MLTNTTEKISDQINQMLVQRLAGQDQESPFTYGNEERRSYDPKFLRDNPNPNYQPNDKYLYQSGYRKQVGGKRVREINWNIENQGKQTIIIL